MKKGATASSVWLRSSKLSSTCSSDKFPLSHGVSRYRYQASKVSWTKAAAACEALGSHLIEMMTPAERVMVSADLSKIPGVDRGLIQIGLKQTPGSTEPAGGWHWYASKIPMTNASEWAFGQPDNWDKKEHVGGWEFAYLGAKFNDHPESREGGSVCECYLVQ